MQFMMEPVFDYEDVKSFVRPLELPPFWIEMAGVSRCDERYRIIRKESHVVVCEYIIKGSGTVHINGQTYYPSAGDVYILPEYYRHEYYTEPSDPWVKIFFNVYGSGVSSLLKTTGLKEQILFTNCEELYPLFEAFFAKTKESIPISEIMEECYTLYVRLLMRLYNKVQGINKSSMEIQMLRDFIEQNIHRELTINEMAAAIFRSRDYTNKLVKNHYNVSLYAYYINLRIDKAKALLQHTSLSVREISERLGYQNSQYFSKQFRSVTGVTPSYYRSTGMLIEENKKEKEN
ncbi:MAG: helix-turn-helix transcriptional regulator [Tyzzerella sp.]|nr:helix-turn-helix transcriptional regulator [Tyzzerella sp.]